MSALGCLGCKPLPARDSCKGREGNGEGRGGEEGSKRVQEKVPSQLGDV